MTAFDENDFFEEMEQHFDEDEITNIAEFGEQLGETLRTADMHLLYTMLNSVAACLKRDGEMIHPTTDSGRNYHSQHTALKIEIERRKAAGLDDD